MSKDLKALMDGSLPPIGPAERGMIEKFILDFAKEVSTDGGKTAVIDGGMIVINQQNAQPRKRK